MKVYVLTKLDLDNKGYNPYDVEVSANLDDLTAIMRKEYEDACKDLRIEPYPKEDAVNCEYQFVYGKYAYIHTSLYWDIFEKEIPIDYETEKKQLVGIAMKYLTEKTEFGAVNEIYKNIELKYYGEVQTEKLYAVYLGGNDDFPTVMVHTHWAELPDNKFYNDDYTPLRDFSNNEMKKILQLAGIVE